LEALQEDSLSREDMRKVLLWIREAQEVRQRQDARSHPLLRSISAVAEEKRCRGIFGVAAFVEVLLKASISHLSYHGSAEQAHQSTFVKAVWLLLFVRWQLEKACATCEPSETHGYCYLNPIQRLAVSSIRPFEQSTFDGDLPTSQSGKDGKPQTPVLQATVNTDYWGSQVDDLLHAALRSNPAPETVGKHLFAAALGISLP
jgi:hypothetical protein